MMQLTAEQEHELDWNDRLQDCLDGDLQPAQAEALEAHLAGCQACRARVKEFERLDEALSTAAPPLTLDASFDARLMSRIEAIDESKRAEARQRLELELQQNLRALARGWRRALAFMVPGIVAGVALAFALTGWLDDSGLTRTLILESAGELGRDTSQLVRVTLTTLVGAGLGLLVARWLASIVEQ